MFFFDLCHLCLVYIVGILFVCKCGRSSVGRSISLIVCAIYWAEHEGHGFNPHRPHLFFC
jgi:hypothetical protein